MSSGVAIPWSATRSKTDGRPDPRPTVRENVSQLGDLVNEFDFNRKPLPALVLPEHPKTDLIAPQ